MVTFAGLLEVMVTLTSVCAEMGAIAQLPSVFRDQTRLWLDAGCRSPLLAASSGSRP